MSNEPKETPFDIGWQSGYKDEIPDCPYDEGTQDFSDWWDGYIAGSNNG